MRRRDLSDEELNQIINLKKAGSSWVKIQRELGINRRTAKRAYDNWVRSQSMEELKEARKDVAAQAFREHMESVIRLAGALVTNLRVPSSLADMDKDTEQFLSWLLDQDLLERLVSISVETKEAYAPVSGPHVLDPQSYRREKELLFESLKVHTRENARLWKDWDEWKEARNNCVKVLRKLRKETSEVVGNYLNQERRVNLLHSIRERSGERDPVKRMAEGVLGRIWQAIREDKLDEESPWFEVVSRVDGTAHGVYAKPGRELVLPVADDTGKSLAEEVTRICELAANNLRKGNMVQQLHWEVRNMKKASEELGEMLNPVKLRPVILRTRCDLCPA